MFGLELSTFFEIGFIVFISAVLQSAVGFGFSLIAVPMVLFSGMSLPEVVAVTIVCSAIQKFIAVGKLRSVVDWRVLFPMMIIGLAALPIGIFCMYQVTKEGQATVKQAIGFCVLFLLVLQWAGFIKPKDVVHRGWGYCSAFFSGVLNGFANIGGPPIVLWILAHNWASDKMRVMTMAFTLVFIPFQLILMVWIFGLSTAWAMLIGLVISPLVLLGTFLGLKVGGMLKPKPLRVLVNVMLLCIAMMSILSPFF